MWSGCRWRSEAKAVFRESAGDEVARHGGSFPPCRAEGLPGGEARLGYIARPGFRTRTRAMIGVKINQ